MSNRPRDDAPHILLIQGANMVWLGKREPELYGTTTAAELDALCSDWAAERSCTLDMLYTNVEGEAINRIYAGVDAGIDGLLINPAGFTYAGYALRDCLKAVRIPYVEVHMTNIERRGMHSITAPVADGVIAGLGVDSYRLGMDGLLSVIARRRQAG